MADLLVADRFGRCLKETESSQLDSVIVSEDVSPLIQEDII